MERLDAPPPAPRQVSPWVGAAGIAWLILTPVFFHVAVARSIHVPMLGPVLTVLLVLAMLLFFTPTSPVLVANKVLGLALRLGLGGGVLAVLIAKGWFVMAAIYGLVFAALAVLAAGVLRREAAAD